MSNYKLFYSPRQTCHSETEICNLFERHAKTLLDQKCKMINEIVEWENNLIRRIQENVDQQKVLLEREYKNQLQYLQTKHGEFLDTALVYEERKNREEIRRLLEQCHELKCKLGSFDYPEQPIPFIQIQNEQQLVEGKLISPRSTSASTNRITQQVSSTSSSIENGCFITSNNSPSSNMTINSNIVEKCPACSMIFPSTMRDYERSHHVNQHFGDI